MAEKSSRIV